jgi:hypothetical protein
MNRPDEPFIVSTNIHISFLEFSKVFSYYENGSKSMRTEKYESTDGSNYKTQYFSIQRNIYLLVLFLNIYLLVLLFVEKI